MREIEIPMPSNPDFPAIARTIEEALVSNGLQITLKTTLGKYPGSTHWHIKNGKDKGILEITLWPSQTRAWFSIQSGRKADWIQPKIARLQRLLKTRIVSPNRGRPPRTRATPSR